MLKRPFPRRALFAGAASVSVSTSLVFGRAGWSQTKRTLTVRHREDIGALDPAYYTHDSDMDVILAVFNRLVDYKPSETWEWQLDAAEAVEQVDDTHIAFRLRRGIQWTGGFGEMTAEDVKFSLERVVGSADPSPFAEELDPLERVDVTDSHAGVLVLRNPSPKFWNFLPWPTASIISKASMEGVEGGRFATEVPASSGPYRIESWTPKQKMVLVRHEGWNGPAPAYDEVVILPVDDDKAAELAFQAGEIDFTDVSLSSIPVFKDAPPEGGTLIVRPNLGTRWMGINTAVAPFDDVRVRRAVQLAVDVPAVLEATFNGTAPRATGLIPPGVTGFRDRLLYPERDLEQARALLAEAGHAGGFATSLLVEGNTDNVTMAQVIQANLAEVGIACEVNAMESGQFWVQGVEAEGDYWKNLHMFIHNWGWTPDPSSATQWFVPEQVGVWNWERWDSPAFGELHTAASAELDPAKRAEMCVRMQDLMEESGAYVFLAWGVNARLCRTSVKPAVYADARHPLFKLFEPA